MGIFSKKKKEELPVSADDILNVDFASSMDSLQPVMVSTVETKQDRKNPTEKVNPHDSSKQLDEMIKNIENVEPLIERPKSIPKHNSEIHSTEQDYSLSDEYLPSDSKLLRFDKRHEKVLEKQLKITKKQVAEKISEMNEFQELIRQKELAIQREQFELRKLKTKLQNINSKLQTLLKD